MELVEITTSVLGEKKYILTPSEKRQKEQQRLEEELEKQAKLERRQQLESEKLQYKKEIERLKEKNRRVVVRQEVYGISFYVCVGLGIIMILCWLFSDRDHKLGICILVCAGAAIIICGICYFWLDTFGWDFCDRRYKHCRTLEDKIREIDNKLKNDPDYKI